MDYSFREISEADDAAVARLIRSNLETVGLDIPGTAYFDPGLDHLSNVYGTDDAKYFVLTDSSDQVVGGIGFAKFPFMESTAELQKLYLEDSVKGAGLGYIMLDHIEEQMRKAGFSHSYLETHSKLEAAIHIYHKRGYREIERPEAVVHSTMDRFFIKDLEG